MVASDCLDGRADTHTTAATATQKGTRYAHAVRAQECVHFPGACTCTHARRSVVIDPRVRQNEGRDGR